MIAPGPMARARRLAQIRVPLRREIARRAPFLFARMNTNDIRELRRLRKQARKLARADRAPPDAGAVIRALIFLPELKGDAMSPQAWLAIKAAQRFLEKSRSDV